MIRPAAGSLVVSQLESRVSALRTAAGHGMRSAWMALAGEDPELIGTLRAYPRGAVDGRADGGGGAVGGGGAAVDGGGADNGRPDPMRATR